MAIRTSRISRLRNKTQKQLEQHTNKLLNFYTLTSLAGAVASLGLLLDNIAIIIGAMVLSPLIIPLIGFSLAIIALDLKRLVKSALAIILGTAVTIFVAYLLGKLAFLIEGVGVHITNEMFLRTEPNLFYFLVALFSGFAGAFSYAKPKVLESLTGIAIAVAVVPPLAVSGLSFALNQNSLAYDSFLLFLFNLAGICFGSILMFLLLGFGRDIEK